MSKCTERDPNRLMIIGLFAMAAANLGRWYLQRHSGLGEDLVDFTSGLLQGIAIALLLLAVWLRGRSLRK